MITVLGQIISIVAGGLGVAVILVTRFYPWLRTKIDSRSLLKLLGPAYTKDQLELSVAHYLPPSSCQIVDPAEGDEPLWLPTKKEGLFEALDEFVLRNGKSRHLLLLADSGMGKTSALINYCSRHLRRFKRNPKIALVPLGIPNSDERIKGVECKHDTVLMLDAFDEDVLANVEPVERFSALMRLTAEFYRVVISCRTQFFPTDEDVPLRTGIHKLGARAAGEPIEYTFSRLYLSPFTEREGVIYISRRYPPWKWQRRRRAMEVLKKVPLLAARPMLLAHIDDVITSGRKIDYSHELYEIMVDAWIRREEGFIRNGNNLREFSELLAVNLYAGRDGRGGERAQRSEIGELAKGWGIDLDGWHLTNRSLLNRDGRGNYKFAHRSVMEYLVCLRILEGDSETLGVRWTDQMFVFIRELLEKSSTGVEPFLEMLIEAPGGSNRFFEFVGNLPSLVPPHIFRMALMKMFFAAGRIARLDKIGESIYPTHLIILDKDCPEELLPVREENGLFLTVKYFPDKVDIFIFCDGSHVEVLLGSLLQEVGSIDVSAVLRLNEFLESRFGKDEAEKVGVRRFRPDALVIYNYLSKLGSST